MSRKSRIPAGSPNETERQPAPATSTATAPAGATDAVSAVPATIEGPEGGQPEIAAVETGAVASAPDLNSTDTPPSEDRQGGAGDSGAGPAEAHPVADAWMAFAGLGNDAARSAFPRLFGVLNERRSPFEAVRVKAMRQGGFRRAGIAHPAEAVDHPAETLTPAQLEQLLAEPLLSVELV